MSRASETTGSELRQDPLSGAWVIVAPGRSGRPDSFRAASTAAEVDGHCPFCPGHEHETPPEICRVAGEDGSWRARVVPNMFPVLEGWPTSRESVGPAAFRSMTGNGFHEVIIETPDHAADLATLSAADVRVVLRLFRDRYRALCDEGVASISIFRNHGRRAGTSLSHPHSQVVAMPIVPVAMANALDRTRGFFERTNGVLARDVLASEVADGRRIILEADQFVVYAPFASAAPFEVWIHPRRVCGSIGQATDEEIDELAGVLRSTLRSLSCELDDPAYNLLVHSTPVTAEFRPYAAWYVRIVPRLVTPAGLELSTGVSVNPVPPEHAAARLRHAIEPAS